MDWVRPRGVYSMENRNIMDLFGTPIDGTAGAQREALHFPTEYIPKFIH